MMFTPSYLTLHQRGELQARAEALAGLAHECILCPHRCGANRAAGETGICQSPYQARVSSAFAHFGEEQPLVGRLGSGTIFFCGCNLRCSFCQNWEISQGPEHGQALDAEHLAGIMLQLQRTGCHNINLVTPTHYTHQIAEALCFAAERGLALPVVYNCGGYESVCTLELLDGVVDIYMPDTKFFDDETGARYLTAKDYGTRAREALRVMHDQVGELELTPQGTAYRGLLIRHLVMPGHLDDTAAWSGWIARELSADSYVNIMSQYRPCHAARGDELIGRAITGREYNEALELAKKAGLNGRGFS